MAANKKIVTLDVGSQRVTMGVFAAGGKGSLTLRRFESAELLADPSADATRTAQVRAAVEELAAKLKVKGELTRYAVSGRSAFMRFVKLPPLDVEQVDQIVEFEAQQNVPFPIDEVVWDYQLIGEDQTSEVEAVIIAVKSETLDELNEAIEASVKTEAVDAAPMAVYNAIRFNYPEVTEPLLLIDIGARSTNLIYVDGDRVFARNSTAVGGATISQAIAKEFDADFTTAEHRKIEDGLVNLGGAYEDPDDPEVAAISKVIRNTLTRLHADIVRTTNQYRGQQGGAAPARVLLAGGSVGLGYAKEFFEEKLKLPVEFFNPLRSVGVGAQVDADLVGREAHRLGELVGLALRSSGVCPMEIDLVPDAVARARDVKSRRPFLVTAAAVVFAALGAGIVHFKSAEAIALAKTSDLKAQEEELSGWNSKIRAEQGVLTDDQQRGAQLGETVNSRTGWLEILNELNQKLPSDKVWVTVLEPLAGSEVIEGRTGNRRDADGAVRDALLLFDGGEEEDENGRRQNNSDQPPAPIDKIHIKGLYRAEGGGAEDVSKFLDRLAESPYFEIKDLDVDRPKYMPLIKRAGAGNRWAYPFEFVLPLSKPIN